MKCLLLAVACLAAGGVAWAQGAPPVSAFARIPAVQQAAMSPSGKKIAILGGAPQDRSLAIATVDQPGLPTLMLGDVETVGISWVGDDHVLARMAFWSDPVGARGATYRLERNIAVNTQAQAISRLLKADDISSFMTEQPIVGVVPGPPARALLVGLQESGGPEGFADLHMKRKGTSGVIHTLLSVDPVTGRGLVVERGDFDTYNWNVDSSGVARVRLGVNELNHVFSVIGRAKGSNQWKLVYSSPDREASRAYYGYSDRDDAVLTAVRVPGGSQLFKIGLANGVSTPLGKPVNGSLEVIFDPHGLGPVAVMGEGDGPSFEWLDPELGAVHASLAKAFRDRAVHLEDWSKDRQRFIIRTASPDVPGSWYLFDRARKELSPLGDDYPELKGAAFGTTRWVNYKARDGLEIPAYVTLPPKGGRGLPLIVLPHGGPTARDHFEFDYLTQFLASRGYAVLRPQFRGSWGFGRDFETAGRQEWGGKIQTDLLDGVAALAADGTIDPSRVCIVGASFGGYSALAGATLHPEAYRCAVSIDGMSDLGLMIVEDSRLYGRDSDSVEALRRDVGGSKSELLAAQSPLRHVEAVRAEVLLVHADRDTIVPIEQSQLFADAMRKAGKPVEMVTLEQDNHYLMKSANRARLLETLDAFLAKNLPVKP